MPTKLKSSTTMSKLKELASDLPSAMRATVETMMEEHMETEVSEQIGAQHHERSVDRSSHRNGYRQRGNGVHLAEVRPFGCFRLRDSLRPGRFLAAYLAKSAMSSLIASMSCFGSTVPAMSR